MPYTGSPLTPDPNKKYSFSFHNDIKNEKNNVRKSANPQNLKDEIMNNKEIKDLLNKYEMLFYHNFISILFLFSSLSYVFFVWIIFFFLIWILLSSSFYSWIILFIIIYFNILIYLIYYN